MHLNGMTYAAIIDSFLSDFHCTSANGLCGDSQAIAGGSGDNPGGPYKIVNDFLEASTETILMGGGRSTTTPADIEIRRNHFFKPMIWKPGNSGYTGGVAGNPFGVKNHLEFKNARRVLFEGNVLQNNWGGFSQSGYSIVLTPKNQNHYGTGICPICQVTDVTIRYSTISHTGAGISVVTGLDLPATEPALAGARFSIHDITIDDVNARRYNGPGTLMLVSNGWPTNVLHDVSINHITGFPDPNSHLLSLLDRLTDPPMYGFSFTNSIVGTGAHPVWDAGAASVGSCAAGDVPITSLSSCFSSYVFSDNALIGTPAVAPSSTWPSGNYFPVNVDAVAFVNYAAGDYHLRSESRYKNVSSDGQDLGANINALNTATSGVE